MEERGLTARLRRDLGTLESYAALIGILVGAGIFRVTSDAFLRTGPSILLGYLLLAPAVLATAVPYAVYLSTPLGRHPGGEYTHMARTFGGTRTAFVGAWLKLIAYIGACAFLAVVLADYLLELASILGVDANAERVRLPVALASLAGFTAVNVAGARWFGRLQVGMCIALGVAIVILVVPGLFAIRTANYTPFFRGGAAGFAAALPPLFFAYAGFESLAQTAGEVADSTVRLPRVFLRGILGATVIFVLMSVVALGVLPGARLEASAAPMAEVAALYLPRGGAAFVAVGGALAVATSLNASLFVPARLGFVLAKDGHLPRWVGAIHPATSTPALGLCVTFALAALLLVSGQLALALNVAVQALVLVYALHGIAFLALPRANPALFAAAAVKPPLAVQRAAGLVSVVAMVTLVVVQLAQDLATLGATSLAERWTTQSLTSFELLVGWGLVGLVVHELARRRRAR